MENNYDDVQAVKGSFAGGDPSAMKYVRFCLLIWKTPKTLSLKYDSIFMS